MRDCLVDFRDHGQGALWKGHRWSRHLRAHHVARLKAAAEPITVMDGPRLVLFAHNAGFCIQVLMCRLTAFAYRGPPSTMKHLHHILFALLFTTSSSVGITVARASSITDLHDIHFPTCCCLSLLWVARAPRGHSIFDASRRDADLYLAEILDSLFALRASRHSV